MSIKYIRLLVMVSVLFTLVVIMLGAYTRLADAGLGCPDWPGCYGHLFVPTTTSELTKAEQLFPLQAIDNDKAWLEMIHRYFAGSLGVLVLIIAIVSVRHPQAPTLLPLFILLLVIAQAALGMWTVTLKLMPIVVMGHLLGGMTLFSLLCLFYSRLTLFSSRSYHIDALTSLRVLAFITLICLVIQIALGGWTAANYAALVCTTLPICQGEWWNMLDFSTAFQWYHATQGSYEFGILDYPSRMTIHVSHRIGAVVASLFIFSLSLRLLSLPQVIFKKMARVLLMLLIIQIGLGISNIVFHLPLGIAVVHNLVAALLLSVVVIINYFLYLPRTRSVPNRGIK